MRDDFIKNQSIDEHVSSWNKHSKEMLTSNFYGLYVFNVESVGFLQSNEQNKLGWVFL